MSDKIKIAKRGDVIIKEGEKSSALVIIQSGSAIISLNRNKKSVEIFPLGASQVFGEQSLGTAGTNTFSLVASAPETKYMEIPLETAQAQIEAAPQLIKLMLKSFIDRLKVSMNDIRNSRLEKDASPCPEDQVAKVFGAIYHTIRHKAVAEDKKNPNSLSMEWVAFKQYAQRVFGESPRRIEQAVNILVKHKIASYVMGKAIDNPEGPDEIQKVFVYELESVEAFFEFFQYYYFKGGTAPIIKYEESSYNFLSAFLKMTAAFEKDRFGVVTFEFTKAIEFFKAEMGINLNNVHLTQLENKGVFAKRQTRADGTVAMSFEYKEWARIQKSWLLIKEIDKWNEKGFVDINEQEKPKAKAGVPVCSNCGVEVAAQAKFCQDCGTKLG